MCALHVRAGLLSGGLPDFWRDMYWGTAIAYGERFPLTGPPINQVLELGPWWFYVLAVPLRLFHSVAVASAFMQLLAALKYVLAWRLGARAVDARFGFVLTVCTAVAGWSTAAFWFPSHPALVETTVLLLAFVFWRCWKSLTVVGAILYGLAASACFHAHPTTATYIVVGGFALLYRYRSMRAAALLALAGTIFLASLLPPFLDPSVPIAGGPKPLGSYTSNEIAVNFARRVPGLWLGIWINGAWMGFTAMTKWRLGVIHLAWGVYCVLLGFAAVGVSRLEREHRWLRKWFLGAFVYVLMQLVFLAVIRNFTPIWMVSSCLPPVTLCLAIGWYGWLSTNPRPLRALGIGAFAVYGFLVLVPFLLFQRDIQQMRELTANTLYNIDERADGYSTNAVPFTSVRDMDALAPALCTPLALHGRLGAAIENAYAVPEWNACGRWPEFVFSGAGDDRPHLVGIPTRAATATGIAPDRVVGHMALYRNVRVIAPAAGVPLSPLQRMQVSPVRAESAPQPLAYEFDATARDVIVLTQRFTFSGVKVRSAEVNGLAATLLHTDGKAWIYGCVACAKADRAHWRLALEGVEANLDLVLVQAPPQVALQ